MTTTLRLNIQHEEDQNDAKPHTVNIRVTDGQSDRALTARETCPRPHQLRPADPKALRSSSTESDSSSKSTEVLGREDTMKKMNNSCGPAGDGYVPPIGLPNQPVPRIQLNRSTSDCRFKHSASCPIKPEEPVVTAQRRRPGVTDSRFRRLISKPSPDLTGELTKKKSLEKIGKRTLLSGLSSNASNLYRVNGINVAVQTEATDSLIEEACKKCDDYKLKFDLMHLEEGERTWRNIDYLSDVYPEMKKNVVAAYTQTTDFVFPDNDCRKCHTDKLKLEQHLKEERSVSIKRSLSDTCVLRRGVPNLSASTESFSETSGTSTSGSNESIESESQDDRSSSITTLCAQPQETCRRFENDVSTSYYHSSETRSPRRTNDNLVVWKETPRKCHVTARHGNYRAAGHAVARKSCKNSGNKNLRQHQELLVIVLVIVFVLYCITSVVSILYPLLNDWLYPPPENTLIYYWKVLKRMNK